MNHALLIFVDGMGMGSPDPAINPIHAGACPNLARLLAGHGIPVDASLGLPGLPQSATGTTTILTGVNAAQRVGRHVEGFPGEALKELIRERSIFVQLAAMGLTATFANAYFVDEVTEVAQGRFQSVTTVAALGAFGRVRDKTMLERNEAVYQDLTRESLRARGYAGPLVSPADSARHLAGIVRHHDFTLFEYFQTDRAGHDGDVARITTVLSRLDEFIRILIPLLAEQEALLTMTSDHGNVEDLRTHSHTLNPVPFVAVGPGADGLKANVRSIADITPALVNWFRGRR